MKSQSKIAVGVASASTTPAAAKPVRRKLSAKPAPLKAEVTGKLGKVVTLLKRPKGASIIELMKVTGWQKHSVRGAISGAIKNRLKLAVISEKTGDVRTYRIKR